MKKYIIYTFCLSLFCSAFTSVKAQLNPLASQYYLNTYLSNPALAGVDTVLTAFVTHRKEFLNFPGSPVIQNVSATYGFKKVGLGININSQKTGLQRETRTMGTFSYHLPFDKDGQKLHFGLSFGFMSQSLAANDINGNPDDIIVGEYNRRDTYLDGDFGIAYSQKKLTIEAALPNLKRIFTKEKVKFADVPTFYSAISYKITLNDGAAKNEIELEPKIVYRGIKGFDNIWDGGVQAAFADQQLLVTALYHSNQSATFGLALNVKKKYILSGSYNTNAKALAGNTNGGFEINIGLRL